MFYTIDLLSFHVVTTTIKVEIFSVRVHIDTIFLLNISAIRRTSKKYLYKKNVYAINTKLLVIVFRFGKKKKKKYLCDFVHASQVNDVCTRDLYT